MSFTVRRASQDDHACLLPVFEQFYRELGLPEAISDMASTLHELLERSDTAVFVAEAGDDVVGAAALSTSFGLEAVCIVSWRIFSSCPNGATKAWRARSSTLPWRGPNGWVAGIWRLY